MKIGNIVSTSRLNFLDEFNIVQSLSECIQGLPTLIIGWDYIHKNYPDYDIINRKLTLNLYWTFKKSEKRDLHAEDISNFIDFCYQKLIAEVKYIYIDLLQYSKTNIVKIIKKIYNSENVTTFEHGEMMYLYINKFIFGIDIKLIKYMQGNVIKVISKIKNISDVFLTGKDILIEYKNYTDKLENGLKYIPFLYLKNHEKNNIDSIVYIS